VKDSGSAARRSRPDADSDDGRGTTRVAERSRTPLLEQQRDVVVPGAHELEVVGPETEQRRAAAPPGGRTLLGTPGPPTVRPEYSRTAEAATRRRARTSSSERGGNSRLVDQVEDGVLLVVARSRGPVVDLPGARDALLAEHLQVGRGSPRPQLARPHHDELATTSRSARVTAT